MACDLIAGVSIDIRVRRFLIGNLGDVKLIVQSAINE
jgi:putative component of toxin-antitoxin plasmid stabilization module